MADDDCPHRGTHSYQTDDLTFLTIERENVAIVLHSPESAEDSPDYEEKVEFPARELAEAYVAAALATLTVHSPEAG
jgi:hypothetical protein